MPEDDPFLPLPKAILPLEALSVNELEARIAELQAEIRICESLVAAKKNHLAAADSLFGGKRP